MPWSLRARHQGGCNEEHDETGPAVARPHRVRVPSTMGALPLPWMGPCHSPTYRRGWPWAMRPTSGSASGSRSAAGVVVGFAVGLGVGSAVGFAVGLGVGFGVGFGLAGAHPPTPPETAVPPAALPTR